MAKVRVFQSAQKGNVALTTALAMVPICFAVLGVVDLSSVSSVKANMQAAADAGALAGASELSVVTRTDPGIIESAQNVSKSSANFGGIDARNVFVATVDRQAGSVTVSGTLNRPSMLEALGLSPQTIQVSSTAESLGNTPLCILQTGTNKSVVGVDMTNTAIVRAPGCVVHSNSTVSVAQSARIEAGALRSVGAASGPITPAASVGALPMDDPFASLDLNPSAPCNTTDPSTKQSGNQTVYLDPGVHCGEIQMQGNTTLFLKPGEHYFMTDVQFQGNSKLAGDDVVLIFGGDDSFDFGGKVDVQLTARKTGIFAGFLIATARQNMEDFTISSTNVKELLGTIYIPNSELIVSSAGSVAQDSAWSVIVAKRLTLLSNPILVINKSYLGSGVPVPAGVGPTLSSPRLSQ